MAEADHNPRPRDVAWGHHTTMQVDPSGDFKVFRPGVHAAPKRAHLKIGRASNSASGGRGFHVNAGRSVGNGVARRTADADMLRQGTPQAITTSPTAHRRGRGRILNQNGPEHERSNEDNGSNYSNMNDRRRRPRRGRARRSARCTADQRTSLRPWISHLVPPGYHPSCPRCGIRPAVILNRTEEASNIDRGISPRTGGVFPIRVAILASFAPLSLLPFSLLTTTSYPARGCGPPQHSGFSVK